ncbi:uncharacterized protein LOC124652623 isoform X2 [Lolium rigidum]|uniref:uncharacterized protein LOC124652623 isoform X2 n=1 Tax=Lolium rigidum TaxID=89674 RepID=UPI001F5D2686|nr:uncharacterized protein LOC124652623 isoform X2 [Lolium rigidum]
MYCDYFFSWQELTRTACNLAYTCKNGDWKASLNTNTTFRITVRLPLLPLSLPCDGGNHGDGGLFFDFVDWEKTKIKECSCGSAKKQKTRVWLLLQMDALTFIPWGCTTARTSQTGPCASLQQIATSGARPLAGAQRVETGISEDKDGLLNLNIIQFTAGGVRLFPSTPRVP